LRGFHCLVSVINRKVTEVPYPVFHVNYRQQPMATVQYISSICIIPIT
jgi:hypothetical protein